MKPNAALEPVFGAGSFWKGKESMRANMRRSMGFKSSSINSSSPYAERDMTFLERIDSQLCNEKITRQEAKTEIVNWAVRTGNCPHLPALLLALG